MPELPAITEEELNILPMTPEEDEQEMIKKFEKDTDKTLYPAQNERIMISLINYYRNQDKARINYGFKQLLLPYANGVFLDLWGLIVGSPRLKATCAKDVLQVKLYEPYTFAQTLPKGAQIETKDGKYIFVTSEELTIPAGETTATVNIQSELAGEILNNYGQGDITNLINNYEYIESVINLNGAKGGSDKENDDHYRERLYLAPERFSTAGPRQAYKYFALSAHKDIKDVDVDCPQKPATVKIGDNIYTESSGKIDCDKLSVTVDYATGKMSVKIFENLTQFELTLSPAATVEIHALTKDGEASPAIINAIKEAVNDEKVRPLTDHVMVYSAQKTDFTLDNLIVTLTRDADYETTTNAVKKALEEYFDYLRTNLNIAVIPSRIITVIGNVEGVYSVDIGEFSLLPAEKTKYYNGKIGTIEFRRSA